MSRAILFLRSLLFALIMLVATLIWAPVCFLAAPLSYNQRYYITSRWNVFIIWLAKVSVSYTHLTLPTSDLV